MNSYVTTDGVNATLTRDYFIGRQIELLLIVFLIATILDVC